MSQSVEIRKTYKYRLYRSKRDFRLHDAINVSGIMKKVGSINQKEGQRHIARRHIRIADKRRDFHFQLAHDLCDYYDILIFEDLNLQGMKALWGRKVSDPTVPEWMQQLRLKV